MHKRGTTKRSAAMRGAGLMALSGAFCIGAAGWVAYRPGTRFAPAAQNAVNAPIVTPDTPLNRRLVEAVQKGDMDAVRTLCSQGASADTSVHWKGSEDSIPIALLAERDMDEERPRFLPIFQWLVVKGSDPNAADGRGRTLLMGAIDMDDLSSAQLLVSRGANVNTRIKQFFTGANALYFAVMQGGVRSKDPSPITLFLLEHGADVNAQDDKGTTPLILAAEFGKIQTVKALLAHHADTSLKGLGGLTALRMASLRRHDDIVLLLSASSPMSLHEAAQFGKLERVRAALNAGAKPNETDQFGLTPLMTAMRSGSVEVAKLLLDRGAGVNVKNKQGRTALHYAALYGDVALANLLLDRGADANAVSPPFRPGGSDATPLTDAIEQAQSGMVDLLLKRGVDVKRNAQGAAALELAVRITGQRPARPRESPTKPLRGDAFLDDQSDIVEHLLAAGADARANNSRALYLAAHNEQTGLVTLLLEKGADVNGRAAVEPAGGLDNGQTALVGAIEGWDMARFEMRQLKEGSLFGPTEADLLASEKNARAMVEFLLSKGADVNIADARGRTPLMECSGSSPSELTQMLLAKGANVNAADADGRTTLMKAAGENDLPFVMLLLAHKADAARQDREGFTALMLAIDDGDNARYKQRREQQDDHLRNAHGENLPPATRKELPNPEGHPDMVRLLLKNGADPNATAKDGTTPLKLAQKNGFDAVIALLKQAGAK